MRSAEEGARRVRNSCTWQHAPATHGSKHLAPRRRASGTSQSGLKVASQGLSRQEVAGWCAPLSPASRKALFTESKCNAIPGRIVSCRVTTPRRQQRKQACREGHNEAVGHHYCACARKRAARRAKGARLCLSQAEIQENLRPGSITTGSQQFCARGGLRHGAVSTPWGQEQSLITTIMIIPTRCPAFLPRSPMLAGFRRSSSVIGRTAGTSPAFPQARPRRRAPPRRGPPPCQC